MHVRHMKKLKDKEQQRYKERTGEEQRKLVQLGKVARHTLAPLAGVQDACRVCSQHYARLTQIVRPATVDTSL